MYHLPHIPRLLAPLLLLLAAIVCDCANRRAAHTLDVAEAVMELHPDSALALLESVDRSKLSGRTQARHALLLSQAYDKNTFDIASDSIISIACAYYDNTDDILHKMQAGYYRTVVSMNKKDYDEALSLAFDVEKDAETLGDVAFLAQVKMLIARAYLYSRNLEGAEDYFKQTLSLTYGLGKPVWIGLVHFNLSNLSISQRNFPLALEQLDSAKAYIPYDTDLAKLEMLALIGQEQYRQADSVYLNFLAGNRPTPQLQAYHLLAQIKKGGTIDYNSELARLLSIASHIDSIDIAFVGNHISLAHQDYRQAWYYTDILLKETNRELANLSQHSLYRIQLEHNRSEIKATKAQLRHKELVTIASIVISVLIAALFILIIIVLKRSHRVKLLEAKNDVAMITSEINELRLKHTKMINELRDEQISNSTIIQSLQQQIESGKIEAQKLFADKYAWLDEIGNIFLDAELATSSANKAMKELKRMLYSARSKHFLPELTAIINRYRDNIIQRVATECPRVSASERDILALLCAHLSPRIIAFILDIKPQSVYNAKSALKHKIQDASPSLLSDLDDIFKVSQ